MGRPYSNPIPTLFHGVDSTLQFSLEIRPLLASPPSWNIVSQHPTVVTYCTVRYGTGVQESVCTSQVLNKTYFFSKKKKIITLKLFVKAFEKMCFFFTWIQSRIQTGTGSVMGKNLDPDPYIKYTDPKHCEQVPYRNLPSKAADQ